MRPRITTSVPHYKGSMSAPPILTTRDLSGKYILVRVFTVTLGMGALRYSRCASEQTAERQHRKDIQRAGCRMDRPEEAI